MKSPLSFLLSQSCTFHQGTRQLLGMYYCRLFATCTNTQVWCIFGNHANVNKTVQYYCATWSSYQYVLEILPYPQYRTIVFVSCRVLHGRNWYIPIQQFMHLCTIILLPIFYYFKKNASIHILIPLRHLGEYSLGWMTRIRVVKSEASHILKIDKHCQIVHHKAVLTYATSTITECSLTHTIISISDYQSFNMCHFKGLKSSNLILIFDCLWSLMFIHVYISF